MTTLVAWVSYSEKGERPELPKAVYFASDSRITWGSKARRWDAGRKLFTPYDEPHLFGYCGDVVFPSLVLGQIVSSIDNAIMFEPALSAEERHECIFYAIRNSFSRRHNAPDQAFSILHAFRTEPWPSTKFLLWCIEYEPQNNVWSSRAIDLPSKTKAIIYLGSGKSIAKASTHRWDASDVGGTSRSIFSAFCDSIDEGLDFLTGGPPQVAALYSKMGPQILGVVKDGKYYLHGLEILLGTMLSNIEWRDVLFQRIDPMTLKSRPGARRFARPKFM